MKAHVVQTATYARRSYEHSDLPFPTERLAFAGSESELAGSAPHTASHRLLARRVALTRYVGRVTHILVAKDAICEPA